MNTTLGNQAHPGINQQKTSPLQNEELAPPRKSLGFRFCSHLVLWSFFFQTLWPSVAFAEGLLHETAQVHKGIKSHYLSLGMCIDDKVEQDGEPSFHRQQSHRIRVDFDQGLDNLKVAVEKSLDIQAAYPGLQVKEQGLTWSAFGMSFLMKYEGSLIVSKQSGGPDDSTVKKPCLRLFNPHGDIILGPDLSISNIQAHTQNLYMTGPSLIETLDVWAQGGSIVEDPAERTQKQGRFTIRPEASLTTRNLTIHQGKTRIQGALSLLRFGFIDTKGNKLKKTGSLKVETEVTVRNVSDFQNDGPIEGGSLLLQDTILTNLDKIILGCLITSGGELLNNGKVLLTKSFSHGGRKLVNALGSLFQVKRDSTFYSSDIKNEGSLLLEGDSRGHLENFSNGGSLFMGRVSDLTVREFESSGPLNVEGQMKWSGRLFKTTKSTRLYGKSALFVSKLETNGHFTALDDLALLGVSGGDVTWHHLGGIATLAKRGVFGLNVLTSAGGSTLHLLGDNQGYIKTFVHSGPLTMGSVSNLFVNNFFSHGAFDVTGPMSWIGNVFKTKQATFKDKTSITAPIIETNGPLTAESELTLAGDWHHKKGVAEIAKLFFMGRKIKNEDTVSIEEMPDVTGTTVQRIAELENDSGNADSPAQFRIGEGIVEVERLLNRNGGKVFLEEGECRVGYLENPESVLTVDWLFPLDARTPEWVLTGTVAAKHLFFPERTSISKVIIRGKVLCGEAQVEVADVLGEVGSELTLGVEELSPGPSSFKGQTFTSRGVVKSAVPVTWNGRSFETSGPMHLTQPSTITAPHIKTSTDFTAQDTLTLKGDWTHKAGKADIAKLFFEGRVITNHSDILIRELPYTTGYFGSAIEQTITTLNNGDYNTKDRAQKPLFRIMKGDALLHDTTNWWGTLVLEEGTYKFEKLCNIGKMEVDTFQPEGSGDFKLTGTTQAKHFYVYKPYGSSSRFGSLNIINSGDTAFERATIFTKSLENNAKLTIGSGSSTVEDLKNNGVLSLNNQTTLNTDTLDNSNGTIEAAPTHDLRVLMLDPAKSPQTTLHTGPTVRAKVKDEKHSIYPGTLKSKKDLILEMDPCLDIAEFLRLHVKRLQCGDKLRLYGDIFRANNPFTYPGAVLLYVRDFEVNRHLIFRSLGVKAKKARVGTSNDEMGFIETKPDKKNPTADTSCDLTSEQSLDLRYGQVFGHGKTTLTSTQGDVLTGERTTETHHVSNFRTYYGANFSYPYCDPNGAFVATDNQLTIKALRGHIRNTFGTLTSRLELRLQAKESVVNLSGNIRSQKSIFINGKLLENTMMAASNHPIWASGYYHDTIEYQQSAPSIIQSSEDIFVETSQAHNVGSKILAAGSVLNSRFGSDTAKFIKNQTQVRNVHWTCRVEGGSGHVNGYDPKGYQDIAMVIAGKAVNLGASVYDQSGYVSGYTVEVLVNEATFQFLGRIMAQAVDKFGVLSIESFIRAMVAPRGYIRERDDGSIGPVSAMTEAEPVMPMSQLPFARQRNIGAPINVVFLVEPSSSLEQQCFMQMMSMGMGRLHYQGLSLPDIYKLFLENGQQACQQGALSDPNAIANFDLPCLFYAVEKMSRAKTAEEKENAVLHLSLPPSLRNAPESGKTQGVKVKMRGAEGSFTGATVEVIPEDEERDEPKPTNFKKYAPQEKLKAANRNYGQDEAVRGSGSGSQPSSFAQAFEGAQQTAHTLYHENPGYNGIYHTSSLEDKDGQHYIRVAMKEDGDCCFHALGITRASFLQNVGTYVDDCERSLLQPGIPQRIQNAQRALELCQALLTTAITQDIAAFRGHDLAGWKATLLQKTQGLLTPVQTEDLNALFDSFAEQKPLPQADWAVVLEKAAALNALIDLVTDDVRPLIAYQEFVGKCVADIWKRIGDDEGLARLDADLKRIGVLDVHGNKRRSVTEADFNPIGENNDQHKKFVRYVQHKIDFATADATRKKEILNDFYGTEAEWLDPSSIMHVGQRFGFKAKLFKKEGDGLDSLRFDAKTPDADTASGLHCRLIVHVNNNHYDVLHPIQRTLPSGSTLKPNRKGHTVRFATEIEEVEIDNRDTLAEWALEAAKETKPDVAAFLAKDNPLDVHFDKMTAVPVTETRTWHEGNTKITQQFMVKRPTFKSAGRARVTGKEVFNAQSLVIEHDGGAVVGGLEADTNITPTTLNRTEETTEVHHKKKKWHGGGGGTSVKTTVRESQTIDQCQFRGRGDIMIVGGEGKTITMPAPDIQMSGYGNLVFTGAQHLDMPGVVARSKATINHQQSHTGFMGVGGVSRTTKQTIGDGVGVLGDVLVPGNIEFDVDSFNVQSNLLWNGILIDRARRGTFSALEFDTHSSSSHTRTNHWNGHEADSEVTEHHHRVSVPTHMGRRLAFLGTGDKTDQTIYRSVHVRAQQTDMEKTVIQEAAKESFTRTESSSTSGGRGVSAPSFPKRLPAAVGQTRADRIANFIEETTQIASLANTAFDIYNGKIDSILALAELIGGQCGAYSYTNTEFDGRLYQHADVPNVMHLGKTHFAHVPRFHLKGYTTTQNVSGDIDQLTGEPLQQVLLYDARSSSQTTSANGFNLTIGYSETTQRQKVDEKLYTNSLWNINGTGHVDVEEAYLEATEVRGSKATAAIKKVTLKSAVNVSRKEQETTHTSVSLDLKPLIKMYCGIPVTPMEVAQMASFQHSNQTKTQHDEWVGMPSLIEMAEVDIDELETINSAQVRALKEGGRRVKQEKHHEHVPIHENSDEHSGGGLRLIMAVKNAVPVALNLGRNVSEAFATPQAQYSVPSRIALEETLADIAEQAEKERTSAQQPPHTSGPSSDKDPEGRTRKQQTRMREAEDTQSAKATVENLNQSCHDVTNLSAYMDRVDAARAKEQGQTARGRARTRKEDVRRAVDEHANRSGNVRQDLNAFMERIDATRTVQQTPQAPAYTIPKRPPSPETGKNRAKLDIAQANYDSASGFIESWRTHEALQQAKETYFDRISDRQAEQRAEVVVEAIKENPVKAATYAAATVASVAALPLTGALAGVAAATGAGLFTLAANDMALSTPQDFLDVGVSAATGVLGISIKALSRAYGATKVLTGAAVAGTAVGGAGYMLDSTPMMADGVALTLPAIFKAAKPLVQKIIGKAPTTRTWMSLDDLAIRTPSAANGNVRTPFNVQYGKVAQQAANSERSHLVEAIAQRAKSTGTGGPAQSFAPRMMAKDDLDLPRRFGGLGRSEGLGTPSASGAGLGRDAPKPAAKTQGAGSTAKKEVIGDEASAGPKTPYKITDDNACASLPIGNRTSRPTPIFPVSNNSTLIEGRIYRGHALDEMRAQGIMPSAVENTIENGITKQGRSVYTALKYDPVNNISVIINTESQAVITVSFGKLKGF